ERADLRALEVLLGELACRLRREPGELIRPPTAERPPAAPERSGGGERRHREREEREEVRRDLGEAQGQLAPALGILAGDRPQRGERLLGVGRDADESPVGED